MALKTVSTRTHVLVGFANPFLKCDTCKEPVKYWHNPERCGCDDKYFNHPCEHTTGVTSKCPSWGPVDGCTCDTPCKK
jgi:hypothetical protein